LSFFIVSSFFSGNFYKNNYRWVMNVGGVAKMRIKGVIMGEVGWHVVFIYGLESEHCLATKK